MEVKEFYKAEFIPIRVGSSQKLINVPWLTYPQMKKVLSVISSILAEDNASAIKSLGLGEKANILKTTEAFNNYAAFIKDLIPRLVGNRHYTFIEKLLCAISEEAITPAIVATMQLQEAAAFSAYLVEKNFETLKNMSASLATIDTSSKK